MKNTICYLLILVLIGQLNVNHCFFLPCYYVNKLQLKSKNMKQQIICVSYTANLLSVVSNAGNSNNLQL